MSIEIKVPTLGESVTEATIARWLKKEGDSVSADEPVVELETDKVSLEVPAPGAGKIASISAEEGSDVEVGAVLGTIEEGAEGDGAGGDEPGAAEERQPAEEGKEEAERQSSETDDAQKREAKADGAEEPAQEEAPSDGVGPAARKLAEEKGVDLSSVKGTGPKGNITKEDVMKAAEEGRGEKQPEAKKEAREEPEPPTQPPERPREREERVKMTRLRKRIAQRLKEAQNNAAMLTTFNEVDMSASMALRKTYQDAFVKKHDIKLGFMSFFVKACIDALKAFPAANAEIDGDEIVYKHYYDIGVAVSTEQGLLVPVIRDADMMSLADIEKKIGDLGKRARANKLAMEELMGGTFSITNGGIFGSMLSTPILNPPQVAILGMHNIVQRAMVMPDGSIQARPMMFIALSYDHRIIDGREAVSFLVRVKQCVEDPARMILDA